MLKSRRPGIVVLHFFFILCAGGISTVNGQGPPYPLNTYLDAIRAESFVQRWSDWKLKGKVKYLSEFYVEYGSTQSWAFDTSGALLERRLGNPWYPRIYTYTYFFENNQLRRWRYEEHREEKVRERLYGATGFLEKDSTQHDFTYSEFNYSTQTYSTYDTLLNQLIEMETSTSKGKVKVTGTDTLAFEFDSLNRLSKVYEKNPLTANFDRQCDVYVYDSLGRIVSSNGAINRSIQYDNRGNIIVEHTIYASRNASGERNAVRYAYTYNEKNDVIEVHARGFSYKINETWVYDYDYDEKGNWVNTYEVDKNGNCTLIKSRVIEYY